MVGKKRVAYESGFETVIAFLVRCLFAIPTADCVRLSQCLCSLRPNALSLNAEALMKLLPAVIMQMSGNDERALITLPLWLRDLCIPLCLMCEWLILLLIHYLSI